MQLWLHQPEGARLESAHARPHPKGRALHSGAPVARWRLQYLRRRPVRSQRHGEGLLRPETGRHSPPSEPLRRARERILALGGLQAANSYVKINLSLFGLYPRKHVPSVPPEIMMLPGNVLYEMSSWTRSILVPLSIVQARGSNRRAPAGFTLDELLLPGVSLALPRRSGLSILFHHLDRVFKVWEKRGSERIRGAAIREAEHWILDRTRFTEGLGAIYPAMMYFIMALDALDYPADHPDLRGRHPPFRIAAHRNRRPLHLPALRVAHLGHRHRAFALGEAGRAGDPRMTRAADWLISKEVRRKGDWSVKRPDTEPSGWAFEFANEFYPDIDDTAMVLLALHARQGVRSQGAGGRRAPRHQLAAGHAIRATAAGRPSTWITTGPCSTGCPSPTTTPCSIPPARISPAACSSACAGAAWRATRPCAAAWPTCSSAQEKDGSWYGRWGVNYIYGSFLAMRGLAASARRAAGAVKRCHRKAAQWLRAIQNADGGWGESCASYDRDGFVPAPSCASQTAWAVLGLRAAGERESAAVRRGVRVPAGPPAARRLLAGRGHHRHRLPQRLLPDLRHVPRLFPAAGAGAGVRRGLTRDLQSRTKPLLF